MIPTDERREGKRVALELKPLCYIDGPDGLIRPATMLDISKSDARLIMTRPLRERTAAYLELPASRKRARRTRLFRVLRVEQGDCGRCQIGGKFVPPLTARDLKGVLYGDAPARGVHR